MASTKSEASARDRLLAAANELFYAEGIHTVGIDRVIDRAGVAKASLYSAFGSKDELVRAYLESRAAARKERISRRIAQHDAPRARILSIFELLGEIVSEPTFRGCAFVNASAEGARDGEEDGIRRICVGSRAWTRETFVHLAREFGAPAPERLGLQLALLYEGAVVSASIERDAGIALEARSAAEVLLDASERKPEKGDKSAKSDKKKKK